MKVYFTSNPKPLVEGVSQYNNGKDILDRIDKITDLTVVDGFRQYAAQESLTIFNIMLTNMQSGSVLTINETHMELLCNAVACDTINYDESMPLFDRRSFLPLQYVIKAAKDAGWQVESKSVGQVLSRWSYEIRLVKP